MHGMLNARTAYGVVVLVDPDWSEELLFSVPVVPAEPSELASDLLSVLLSLEVLESAGVLELSDDPVVALESDEPPVAASGVD